MTLAQNTPSGKLLADYVSRIETIRAAKKGLSNDEAAVLAEAKSQGFAPTILRAIVARRARKPHDVAEAEALFETYMAALGMATEAPLFRHVGLMQVDTAKRDEVIEALKRFTPHNGSITIEAGGRPVRLTRDENGDVIVAEVQPPKPAASASPGAKPARAAPPDVDAAGAEQLGREAFANNTAIIANPFPFGDARRARWDFGWRAASGGDGMGPEE